MTTIKGNLGRDPEFRFTRNGTPVASFSVAHTPRRKNDAGEWEDAGETVWYRVTAWEDLAEAVAEHLTKGSRIEVELTDAGVKDREYVNRDGETKVSRNECTARRITLKDGTALESGVIRQTAAQINPADDPWATSANIEAPF
jgi:single-strand DNA-binding protein